MSTRPVLLIHIGHGKTGSTSIQRTLEGAREALEPQGVSYLGRMLEFCHADDPRRWQHPDGAEHLLYRLSDDEAADQVFEVLSSALSRLESAGFRLAVWSNEALFARRKGVSAALERLIDKGFEVRILVYLRRHDRWARSAYAQWGIRHKADPGLVKTFAEWIEDHPVQIAHLLEFWDGAHGDRLTIRNFDQVGDVVADILGLMEVNGVDPVRVHDTPTEETLVAWAVHNSRTDDPVEPDRFARLLNASGLLGSPPPALPDPAQLLPSSDELARLLAHSSGDIEQVNEILKKHGVVPFHFDNPCTGMDPPDNWKLVVFLMTMLFSCQEQILRLRRRIDELER